MIPILTDLSTNRLYCGIEWNDVKPYRHSERESYQHFIALFKVLCIDSEDNRTLFFNAKLAIWTYLFREKKDQFNEFWPFFFRLHFFVSHFDQRLIGTKLSCLETENTLKCYIENWKLKIDFLFHLVENQSTTKRFIISLIL